jgi:hypothetical protein
MPRNKQSNTLPSLRTIVTVILSAAIAAACGFLFLYAYRNAYDRNTNGGFFSPQDGVILDYILISVAAILLSVLFKIVWRRRLTLWVLLAISVILPILCWQINYHTLKRDGMLYFLVEEGGPLHFVTIHDFDLDGVDDSLDYTGDDVRTLTHSTLVHSDPHGIVEFMEYTIVGKGGKLDYAGCELNPSEGSLRIRLNKSRVTYERITVTLHLTEAYAAEDLVFYRGGERLAVKVIDGHTLSVTFDADTCAEWQQQATEESFRVLIRCEAED